MNDTPDLWDLFGAGVAIGGTAVWVLAAAARVGVLRAILDIFPRAAWDAVTWLLIPALLLVPIVVQGFGVALLDDRRRREAWIVVAGAAAGSLVTLMLFGAILLLGVRQLPKDAQNWLGRSSTVALILGFFGAVIAGWLLIAARLARRPQVRWMIVPAAAIAVAALWGGAHHIVLAMSYVLDRPEANGFFAAVALGGSAGSVWMIRREAAAVSRRDEARARRARRGERGASRPRRRVGASHGT